VTYVILFFVAMYLAVLASEAVVGIAHILHSAGKKNV
jgi:hypothetical protein